MEKVKQDLENIKDKLIEHIKTNFPEDKATEFISNIQEMDDENFIKFLKEQKLINSENECIFCSIISNKIPSTKIGENSSAIAILDINPVSKGHCLIVPKKHIESEEELDLKTKELAQEISNKLMKTFSPKRISATPGNVMGHQIINLLPIYENESMDSPRKQESEQNLLKLKEEIESTEKVEIKKEEKIEQKQEEINEKNTWLPKRLP